MVAAVVGGEEEKLAAKKNPLPAAGDVVKEQQVHQSPLLNRGTRSRLLIAVAESELHDHGDLRPSHVRQVGRSSSL